MCYNYRVKICKRCKEMKGLEDFSLDKRYPQGRTAICKRCSANRVNKWRHKEDGQERFESLIRKFDGS